MERFIAVPDLFQNIQVTLLLQACLQPFGRFFIPSFGILGLLSTLSEKHLARDRLVICSPYLQDLDPLSG